MAEEHRIGFEVDDAMQAMGEIATHEPSDPVSILNKNYASSDVSFGPLPISWQSGLQAICCENNQRYGLLCNKVLTLNGVTVLGFCMIALAILLFILLVKPNTWRKSKSTESNSSSNAATFLLRFPNGSLALGIKFFFLMGFYLLFLRVFILIKHHGKGRDEPIAVILMCASSLMIVVPIVVVSAVQWWKLRHRSHPNGSCPPAPLSVRVEAVDVYQDLTTETIKATAIGTTQVILLVIYIFAVAQDISENYPLNDEVPGQGCIYMELIATYLLTALMQASYGVGINDVFSNISSQTTFWLDAFFIGGKESFLKPVYVHLQKPADEDEDDDDDDDDDDVIHASDRKVVGKTALLIRFLVSTVINIFGGMFITVVLPLHLALSTDPTDLVLNATAAYFICELDDGHSTKYWLSMTGPKSSLDCEEEQFTYRTLRNEASLGYEIRQYSAYNHVEYDSLSAMKIAMESNVVLDNSHVITEAIVGNDDYFEIVRIKQPVIGGANVESGCSSGISSETRSALVAVANISHPRFDCTIFNPSAGMSEILSHANSELRSILRKSGFQLSNPPLSERLLGREPIVFARRNILSPKPSSEVWIYLEEKEDRTKNLQILGNRVNDESDNGDNGNDGDMHCKRNMESRNDSGKPGARVTLSITRGVNQAWDTGMECSVSSMI